MQIFLSLVTLKQRKEERLQTDPMLPEDYTQCLPQLEAFFLQNHLLDQLITNPAKFLDQKLFFLGSEYVILLQDSSAPFCVKECFLHYCRIHLWKN